MTIRRLTKLIFGIIFTIGSSGFVFSQHIFTLKESCDEGGKACDELGPCDEINTSTCGCYDWSGRYLGFSLGMNWIDPNTQPNLGLPASSFEQPESLGFLGGTYVGKNFQRDRFVFGIEGDWNGTTNDETVPCLNPAFDCSLGSDWNASLRGRLGIAKDRLLVYTTGGYALADFEGFTRVVASGQTFSDSHTLSGFAAGGGMEYAWSDGIHLRTEYLYKGFDKEAFAYDFPYVLNPQLNSLTFGVSFGF